MDRGDPAAAEAALQSTRGLEERLDPIRHAIEVLSDRDVKGLYKKALAGEIKNFTGVDDPYEPPLNAEVTCPTDKETPEESARRVVAKLEQLGYLAPAGAEDVYTPEEEEKVRRRLEALGYMG